MFSEARYGLHSHNGYDCRACHGASLNDVVEMVVYDAFGVADSYTKSQSDTRYPFKGNDSIIRLNGQTISADITIDSDENGVSAGPITQDNATVTVNGYWSIV